MEQRMEVKQQISGVGKEKIFEIPNRIPNLY